MVIKGLTKYGYIDEARSIAINGLEGMLKTLKNTGTLWENYDQEKPGQPGEKASKGKVCHTDFVGWSGIQPIATLLETIIGIQTQAPANKIEWTLRSTEQHGIRNLKWGKNYSQKVDLISESRASVDQPVHLTISSDTPFTLVVDTGFAKQELSVKKGADQSFVVHAE
jgi:hypothetical protein